jgi:hypothetical protein
MMSNRLSLLPGHLKNTISEDCTRDVPKRRKARFIALEPHMSQAAKIVQPQQLGNFELPPPTMHKYPFTNTTTSHPSKASTTTASIGNFPASPNTYHRDVIGSNQSDGFVPQDLNAEQKNIDIYAQSLA